jgi:hypothetical protein
LREEGKGGGERPPEMLCSPLTLPLSPNGRRKISLDEKERI